MLTWEPAQGGSGSPSVAAPSVWLRQSQAGGSGSAILPGGTSRIPAGTWENTFSSFLFPSRSAGAAAQPPGAFKRHSLLEAGSTLVGNRKGKVPRATGPARAAQRCLHQGGCQLHGEQQLLAPRTPQDTPTAATSTPGAGRGVGEAASPPWARGYLGTTHQF